jgi:putative hydrolase of the HAD superfamily
MIKYLLFDLDNTLYSARYGLEDEVARRIIDFAAARLGIPRDEAATIHQSVLPRYGTTLEWLMAERGFTDPEAYWAAIHPATEARALRPDPALRGYLANLPVPKAILTNSPREHAERVLHQLGMADLFTHIVDIRFNELIGKPHPAAFRRALAVLEGTPDTVLFVDDCAEYVEGYRALGGAAVLLDEADAHPTFPGCRIKSLFQLGSFIERPV